MLKTIKTKGMIKRLLILLTGFILSSDLWSQPMGCNNPMAGLTCEEAPVLCDINTLDGYCTTLPDFNNPTGPSPLCNGVGVPNNTIWFGFIAGTSYMSLDIIPSNCNGSQPGIQGGIYSGPCGNVTPVVCQGVCFNSTINLSSGGFVPGQVYWFIIDGCNGSVCDVTVDVISGGPLVMGSIDPITGPKKVCLGGTFNYNTNVVNGADYYYWTLDGTLLSDPLTEDNQVSIQFNQEGVFQLCVDVANYCIDVSAPPVPKCIDITVTKVVGIDPPPVKVCPGDSYTYHGLAYNAGVYDITLTSWKGCDSVITLTIDEWPIPQKDLGVIYKCYPDCITIQDTYGNGGVYCDPAESEQVYLQTWKGCDSIITYTLRLIELNVSIDPPYDIGCSINQTPLDGSSTLNNLANYDHLNIKWTALNGGILLGPDDQLVTSTETGGKYCLTVEAVAPGGTPICKDSACVIVKFDPFSPTASIIGDTISCYKDTIVLTGVTSDPGSTYKWVGPTGKMYTGKTIKVGTPGLYQLTVTAPNLCQATASYTVISLKGGPNIDAVGGLLNCANTSLVITGSSTTPNVSYKWFAPDSTIISNNTNATVTVPGNYTFLVHNNKTGCDTTKTVVVDGDFIIPQNVTASADTLTCILTPVPLLSNSTTPGVTYAWTGPNGFTSNSQNTSTTKPGNYCVIVTNPLNGCKDTMCAKMYQDTTQPSLTIVNDTIDCFTYTATVKASSNGTNPVFSWTGPSGSGTGTSYTTGINGTVSVKVTDSYNGCTNSGSVNVIGDPNKPKATASVLNSLSCDSLQVALYGSSSLNLPSIIYSWSFLSNKFATTKNTFAVEPGKYTFLVTNTNNGCADSAMVNVLQNIIAPDVTAINDTTDCVTGKATLKGFSVTPNAQFKWWDIPHGANPIANTKNLTIPAGKYNLVVRDPVNGCMSDITVEAVKDENTPDVTLVKDNDLNCNLLVSTLTASSTIAGLNYAWTGGTATGDPKVVTTMLPGDFTVSVTNPVNLCKNAAKITVTQDINHPVLSAVTDTIKCNNPTAHIDGSSDITINTTVGWKDPAGNPAANVLDFTTTTPGKYVLTVTNNTNGCGTTINLIVPQNTTIPNISATGAKIDCANPIVTAKGNSTTPNVKFNWSGPGGFSATTKDATGINTKGTYTFTVTDKVNGCSSAQDVTVDEDIQTPDLVLTGGTLTCTNNKSVTLTATSKTAGVTYSWTGPNGFTSTQQNPVVTAAGTYSATVTNSVNHCTFNTSVDVLDDTTPPDLSVNDAVIDCINTSQALNAVSTTPGVVYSWNGPGVVNVTTPSITVTKAGSYVIEVTAPNGCKTPKTSTVTLNAILPVAIATAIGELNCTNKSVQVNTTGSSTGPNYVYTWTGPGTISNNQQFDATVAGIYALTITNTSNGCTKDTTVTVPENLNKPTGFVADQSNPKCFGGNNGSINVTAVTGGTPPYLYSINGKPFSSQNQFTFLTDGTYKVSIQDAAGCEFDDLLTLVQPKKLVIHAGKDSIIKWGTPITLYADTINAANVNTITWTPNLDSNCINCLNPTVTLFDAQLFTITVKDFNGCVSSDKVLILVKKERPVFIPNTFSPNGDGINDIFFINAGDGIEEVTYFQIYDRWGNKIFDKESFQPNDPAFGWNGVFRGKKVNSAVFVYWALIKFKDGESILYKGDVTVQR